MVAIRTQGLFLSSIIGYQEGPNSPIKPMVTEEYLTTLVELANRRFLANEERKQRFRRALLKLDKSGKDVDDAWEPTEKRRERKRAEGLRRKEEMRQCEAEEQQRKDVEDGDDDYATGLGLDAEALPP